MNFSIAIRKPQISLLISIMIDPNQFSDELTTSNANGWQIVYIFLSSLILF